MIYSFDRFELDLDLLQLRRGGDPVPIQPQVFDVLRHLIEHRHRVVPKEELLDSIWGDRFVSESALSSRIKSARQALGDNGERQAFIRTAHGRGFQFVAAVSTSQRAPSTDHRPPAVTLPPSRFVGRDADRRGVSELLRDCRMVTIWGTGGVGKTRLAKHVAAQVAGNYPDGVHLVELAAIGPDQDVARRVSAALGVSEQHESAPVDRLAHAFAGQRSLIVLDNCEHVVQAAREIAASVVAETDTVDVLVTSRRPLGLDGEHLWSLAPLGLRATTGIDVAPAVELFVDRVRTTSPGLDLDGAADVVASICARLDGIPLLLELAAARVRHIGLRGVLDSLADPAVLDRLDDGPDRHGSVDAMIRWSYDLLTDDQRELFGALAVFPAWFDLDGAGAVAGADVRTALWQLTDQSLVTVDLSDRRPRYRLLQPVRAFAQRHQPAGLAVSARQRHTHFVLDAVTQHDRLLRGPEGVAAMRRLVNLDADAAVAHADLAAAGDAAGLSLLAGGLFVMTNERMRSDLQRLFETAGGEDGALATPVPLAVAAVGAWQRGDLSGATRILLRALELAGDDSGASPFLHLVRGQVLQLSGAWREATDAGARAAELSDGSHAVIAAKGWAIAALASSRQGEHEASADFARRLADVAQSSQSPLALAWSAYVDGEVAAEHHPREALDRFDAAAALAEDAGSLLLGGAALLASVSLRCRTLEADTPPLSEFATLIRHWQRLGNWAHQWVTLRNLALVLGRSNRLEPAATLYGAVSSPHAEVSPYGPEADRLASSVEVLRGRLGADRCDELIAHGSRLAPADVIALALGAVRDDA